jgi:hypothetical protein
VTPQQLEALIAHELAHVRRHDYFVNVLQMVVETLLFYHPAVWWVSSRIRYERELCCDDLAVRSCGNAVSYARALARLERLRTDGPTLAMGSANGALFHRIQRLLGHGRTEYGPSKFVCGVGLLVGVLSLGFFMSNARAQQEPVAPLPPIQALPALPAIEAQPAPPTAAAVALPALQDVSVASVVPAPAPPVPPAAPAKAFAATPAAPVLQIPPAPPAPPAPRPPQSIGPGPEAVHWVLFKGNDVLVRGNSADEEEAQRARRSFSGDLLWFKLDGKAYVTQDLDVLIRAQTAMPSTPVDVLSERLKQLAIAEQTKAMMNSRLAELDVVVQQMNKLAQSIQAADPASLEDASARLKIMETQSRRLQAELAQTEAMIGSMQAQMQALEVATRNLEPARRQDLDIFREAVISGKAKAAP